MMAAAGGEHGWVIMNLAAPLATFVRQHQLGIVFGAETGFVIRRNPDTVRAPDIGVVFSHRVPDPLPAGFLEGPPDLAVEVLSPGDTIAEVLEKAEDWLTSGCREVWLIDPRRRVASQCTWDNSALVRRPVDRLASPLLPGFEMPVVELFRR